MQASLVNAIAQLNQPATLSKQSVPSLDANADGTPTPSAVNLRRLVALRAISLGAQLTMILIAVNWLGIVLPLRLLLTTLFVAAAINALTWSRLHQPRAVSDRELFAHLVLDVLLLTATLYFSGGSTNPFATLYLIPLTLTAAALPWRFTWPMLILTIACYSLLLRYHIPLFHSHHGEPHVLDDFQLHVVGTWLGFILSGGLIAFFAVRMRETVRERDRLLAQVREQALRHERVLALGTFAAGAAHELGTPLATIAVLSKELQNGVTAEQLRILREQVDHCKKILGSMSAAVDQPRAESGGAEALDTFLRNLIERWRVLRPHVDANLDQQGATPAPRIVTDLTVGQALVNVLNNAADASRAIEVISRWDANEWIVAVTDHGAGLSPQAQEHAGEPFFTTKEPGAGMGLGLFLARGTIERLGGALTLTNRAEGGAECRIRIPLNSIRLSDS